MIAIHVSVPIACFRKGLAREYLETEPLPPPSTCYGFLLSLVGETNRERHIGSRLAPVLLGEPEVSTVLRTVWRVKSKPLGATGNTRPDYQQLLSHVHLLLWLDSADESASPNLEQRVTQALTHPDQVTRFGGLSLGESTHLVDEVSLFNADRRQRLENDMNEQSWQGFESKAFLLDVAGNLTLPVWVDHVGSAGTLYCTGSLKSIGLSQPEVSDLPQIQPPE